MTRPPIGTPVRFRENGKLATVIPTHWQAPDDEVDVMLHGTGSVMTARIEWLDVLDNRPGHRTATHDDEGTGR